MSTRCAGALVAMAVVSAGAIPAAAQDGASRAERHRVLTAPRGASASDSRTVRSVPRGASATASHTVVLEHERFLPGTLSIRRGESVTWLWRGGVLHNVIGHGFQSRTMTHGSFTLRFTRSGIYSYTCTVHPHMDGSVTVR